MPGSYGRGAIPVPISNTEVKPPSADDTAALSGGKVGRRRAFLFIILFLRSHFEHGSFVSVGDAPSSASDTAALSGGKVGRCQAFFVYKNNAFFQIFSLNSGKRIVFFLLM